MIRDDLSDKLIHLTRGPTHDDAARILLKILKQKQLLGGTGDIEGGFRCVCFSEAPLSKLSYILANPAAHSMRYAPFGVMIDKKWLFERGGRPVIYQPDSEYPLLSDELKFRHKTYDPTNSVLIDVTWEREWRIQTDALMLDPDAVTVVLPNRVWERKLLEPHERNIWLRGVAGVVAGKGQPLALIKSPWHFVVLEDLGVSIPMKDSAADLDEP